MRQSGLASQAGAILKRPVGRWAVWVLLIAVAVFVVWLARTIRIGVVVSDSMDPTLKRGDVYVIRIDAYGDRLPQRGDIVVVKRPENHENLVKRVIAVEGDLVGVAFGQAMVNGVWPNEPYIKRERLIRERPVLTTVPAGEIFLLGDNRNFSEDSRDIGTLKADHVLGRVDAVIYPWSRRKRIEHVELEVPEDPPQRLW
ncbi:MAG: signal peptidase I [Armatimonadetes bacterium]|nr:signal peptidase I [Armatimonadota bacterium]